MYVVRADGLQLRAHRQCARPRGVGVLADVLRRRYGGLAYARNITDIDDKINNAASEQGVPIATITDRFAAAYREDMARWACVHRTWSPPRRATSPRSST
jgi:cysteinyl-tRNA synthetase